MIVKIISSVLPDFDPPSLYLQPQDGADQLILERLLQRYKTVGHGRHAEHNTLLHVELPLTDLRTPRSS